MFAQHLHDKPTLCFVRPVLYADITTIDTCLPSASVVRATLEDRL